MYNRPHWLTGEIMDESSAPWILGLNRSKFLLINLNIIIKQTTTQSMVEEITYNGQVLAIVLPYEFRQPGIHFFTPDSYSQQLAYMRHPEGKVIKPHIHRQVRREVFLPKKSY